MPGKGRISPPGGSESVVHLVAFPVALRYKHVPISYLDGLPQIQIDSGCQVHGVWNGDILLLRPVYLWLSV